ncbi:MAG: adenylate cyclase, partial [Candidatus Entotheonellia bacterium]
LGMDCLPSVMSRVWMVWCCAELGSFPEAMRWGEEGVQLAEAADHPFSRVMAAFGAGLLSLRQGNLPKAIPLLESGLAGCQGEQQLIWFPWIAACLGLAYALGGRIVEALPLLEQSVEQANSRGILGHQSLRLAWLGEAYLLASRREDALSLAGHALELARDHQERACQGWALRLLGEIAAHGDPPQVEPAEDRYRQAMALADELGLRPLQARCHLGLGSLYRQSGRFEQSHAELAAAVELFRAMDMPLWLSRAEAALLSSPS